MALKNKVHPGFLEAIRDIPNGATIGFGGFALPGLPGNLILALAEHGAKDLTAWSPTPPAARATIRASGCWSRAARCARRSAPSRPRPAPREEAALHRVLRGLATSRRSSCRRARWRSAYAPAAPASRLLHPGRRRHRARRRQRAPRVQRPDLPAGARASADYAFVRAWKADEFGNLVRRSQRNFNPLMAKAARLHHRRGRRGSCRSARSTPTRSTPPVSGCSAWSDPAGLRKALLDRSVEGAGAQSKPRLSRQQMAHRIAG